MATKSCSGMLSSCSTSWSKCRQRMMNDSSEPRHKRRGSLKELLSDFYVTKLRDMETMKMKLNDILLSITWRDIAHRYFGKSSSWLYHKMDGIDGNGGKGEFSPEEARQLQAALYDLSDRIRAAADRI